MPTVRPWCSDECVWNRIKEEQNNWTCYDEIYFWNKILISIREACIVDVEWCDTYHTVLDTATPYR
jgi:hypothetical protein